MKVKQEHKNELFKRQEIELEIEAEKNPSFDEMRKKLSEKYSKPEENINVYSIKGGFGSNLFLIKAYVYNSKHDLEKAIQKSKKQRVQEKKEKEDAEKEKAEAEKAKKEAEEAKKASEEAETAKESA